MVDLVRRATPLLLGSALVAGALGCGSRAGGGEPTTAELCPATIRFEPEAAADTPGVVGEWNGFDLTSSVPLRPEGTAFVVDLDLPPGLQAYDLVWDEGGSPQGHLDPGQTRRKYVDGVEHSALLVRDCNLPALEVVSSAVRRLAADQGTYHASLAFVDAFDATGPDPAGYEAELMHDFVALPLAAPALQVAEDGTATLALSGLADGKYTLRVRSRTASGRLSEAVLLPFWVEAEPFDWRDAVIYMAVTDRFADGDPTNDPLPILGVDPRGDWQGGDLRGIAAAIAEGTLDALGVRALWLTPFNTAADGAYLAADDIHLVTGYHGYWPVRAREVDPRLGGAAALEALVAEAHAHGIRVLLDDVLNDVHQDHEYVATHPDWFRTTCVCGAPGCDYTEHALDCMFRSYLPDVDHRVPEANQQFVDDALFWLERFDLDGARVDAVGHIEDAAVRNLVAAVRERFELAETKYFVMGQTGAGWSDCADPCNDASYAALADPVGPHGLDGQLDAVLYHAVSYRSFATEERDLQHADYWFRNGQSKWPPGAIMTPYLGSAGAPRFVTLADYRGQDAAHDLSVPFNAWTDVAVAPGDAEPYRRARVAMSWLLTLPGAPLLYYGDPYGQWGGADPNDRPMWRPPLTLDANEQTTLEHTRALGQVRRSVPALRRGDYVSIGATADTLVFAREAATDIAIVALTRLVTGDTASVDLSPFGLQGTTLTDALGGPSITVAADGSASIPVPPSGVVVLAP